MAKKITLEVKMNPIQYWRYDMTSVTGKTFEELKRISVKGTYNYINPVSSDEIRSAIQEKTTVMTLHPPILVDPTSNVFLYHTSTIRLLKPGMRCYFVNGKRFLPATVTSVRPLKIDFIDLSGVLNEHTTYPFHLYLLCKDFPELPVNPLILLTNISSMISIRYLETPKIGQQITYLNEPFQVQQKLANDRYLVTSKLGQQIEVYRTDFFMTPKLRSEYLDLNGSIVYFHDNVIGRSVKRLHAEVGEVIFFTENNTLIIHNSRGYIEVDQAILLPSDFEIKKTSRERLGDMFRNTFDTWRRLFPESNWERYYREHVEKPVPTPVITKSTRRKLTESKYDDYKLLWEIDDMILPFKYEESEIYLAKTKPPRLDFRNEDGDLMIPINGFGRRPSVELFIILLDELQQAYRPHMSEVDKHKFLEVFSKENIFNSEEDDIYEPVKLLLNQDAFEYCYYLMESLGYDSDSFESATDIVTKLLLSERNLEPICDIGTLNKLEFLLNQINSNIKVFEELDEMESYFFYKYYKNCQAELLKRQNELSQNEMNSFAAPIQEELRLGVPFYTQLKLLRNKNKHIQTSQEIYQFVQDFIGELDKYNEKNQSAWQWDMFIDQEMQTLLTPSAKYQERQMEGLSFSKKTDLLRFNYFWDTFLKIIYNDGDGIDFPEFPRLEDQATRFVANIVQQKIDDKEEDSNIGLFSIISVGALVLLASYAIRG